MFLKINDLKVFRNCDKSVGMPYYLITISTFFFTDMWDFAHF